MFNKSLSLVIPVFNEEEIIEETIDIFTNLLSGIVYDFEIIVVNDGSTDATAEILKQISLRNNRLRVIQNYKNMGSGISLWRGFREARNELILSNFADRPFDLNDLRLIIPLFYNSAVDFVIVVRKNRSANNFFRKFTSYINFLMIRLLFNIKISDFQFIQIYKRQIIQNLDLLSSGTFVPPEIIIRLISRRHSYKQVCCDFYKRPKGHSKCGNMREYLKTLREMFMFWFYYRFKINNNFSYVY